MMIFFTITQVFFTDMPHFLLCGEVRQVKVEIKNSSHQVLTNLKLASTNPEFFTFGSASVNACDNNGVYATLVSTSDSDSEETLAELAVVKHVLSLPIPNDSIAPGQSVRLPMWIRGPESSGTHSIDFLFYNESDTQKSKIK